MLAIVEREAQLQQLQGRLMPTLWHALMSTRLQSPTLALSFRRRRSDRGGRRECVPTWPTSPQLRQSATRHQVAKMPHLMKTPPMIDVIDGIYGNSSLATQCIGA